MTHSVSDIENIPSDGEEEGEGEEEQDLEEEPEVYFSEDFISGPFLSEAASLPGNILEFDYSYGYDCKRYYNLTVADENTLIFASGNFINFLNVETKEHWFRRSAFGGGIGHITKNPNPEFPHIAVGENGTKPPIIIYDWPSMEIVCLLKNGTAKSFTHLNYSPDGMLLASQGGEPDFLITIFNWAKSRILLRCKSNVNEVYRVMFSPDVPGQLTTGGLAHIKFWKMVRTFTGLKLQGNLGRFGKTEYCDILGVYPMADEKVVSGSEWGNILIWEEGLIRLEVTGINNHKCHDGPITQFYYSNGDLWSIGMDGRVRVWFYDSIDQADPPDDHRYFETEPIYDFYMPGIIFMCIYKENDIPEDTFYYAQDGNGGLWHIDLNTNEEITQEPPQQLYICHAGAIADIAACPWGPYLASLGVDGRLHIYEYEKRKLLFVHQYPAKGATILWLPLHVQHSGDQIIMGFDDGNLRVGIIDITDPNHIKLTTIQVTKPHNRPITQMILNTTGNILVTGGEDATIFIFELLEKQKKFAVLVPIGYIRVPGIVTYLCWHHLLDDTVLVGCIHGHFVQVEVPSQPQDYTTITYILYLEPKHQRFITYKAQIRRDIKVAEINARKAAKLVIKMEQLEQVKKDNPGMDIDEELFLADSDSEEELEPLHIPDIPNRVLWMQSTDEGTIWLSMGGYDAGYIYEYYIDQNSEIPSHYQIIFNGDDIQMNNFVYSYDRKYLILAMEDGSIKVVKVNPDDWRDFSDYWQLSMHDNYNGFVPRMCFSYDEKYFFSCGHDGNIFSYRFYPEEVSLMEHTPPIKFPVYAKPIEVEDIDGYTNLSLEEAIVKAEEDRINRVANEHKRTILEKLKTYKERFKTLLDRNNKLKFTQIIPREIFETDPRITADLNAKLDANLALVKRKLAFQVEKSQIGMEKLRDHFMSVVDVLPSSISGIQNGLSVKTARQRRLDPKFGAIMDSVDLKIEEEVRRRRGPERQRAVAAAPPVFEKRVLRLEYFLAGLSTTTIQKHLGAVLTQLLTKYRYWKQTREDRKVEWAAFKYRKPQQGLNDPNDEAAIVLATQTMGFFPLKSAFDYKPPPHQQVTMIKKYKELLIIRLRQFNLRYDFNLKVLDLRTRKVQLRDYMVFQTKELKSIHEEINEESRKEGPPIPIFSDRLFLEDNLEVVVQVPLTQKEIEARIPKKPVVPPPKGDLLEKEVLMVMPPLTAAELKNQNPEFASWFYEEDTAWETEIRSYRQQRKVFEQDVVLQKIDNAIRDFDNKLEALSQEKLLNRRDGDFIDVFLLTLNEELQILNEIEKVEDALQQNVNNKLEESLDMKDSIDDINTQVKNLKMEIKNLVAQENDIREQFLVAANDSKFYDFLRRIFKKRYRPPKIRDPDDTSSSESDSSSSSEEEADAASIDSRDFGIIRYDENVCPKGCDQKLYDLTFELRNNRHQVEIKQKDCKTLVGDLQLDLERRGKKLTIIEHHLKLSREKLEEFQREKQRRLNQVTTTVILRLHQLQHLVSRNRAENVTDALVFSKFALTKLYKRVGELYNETLREKATHRKNIIHACRMRTDINHMHCNIKKIMRELSELMIMKFGQELNLEKLDEEETKGTLFDGKINIDELKEVDLKKMIFNLRMSKTKIHDLFNAELQKWKDIFDAKRDELIETIKSNTARTDLLAVLNTEKTNLVKLISWQIKKQLGPQRDNTVTETFKEDIKKLVEIIEHQTEEIQLLKLEIRRLSLKGLPSYEKLPKIKEKKTKKEKSELEVIQLGTFESVSSTTTEQKEVEIAVEDYTTSKELSILIPETVNNMAKSLILDLLENLESYQEMSTHITESIVEQIIKDVLNRGSVIEIIENILVLLPVEPTAEQRSLVEFAAEQIYGLLQHVEDESDKEAKQILDVIIDKAILTVGVAPHKVVTQIFKDLVENLSSDFLLKPSTLHTIVDKTKDQLLDSDKDSLIGGIIDITGSQAEYLQTLLNEILTMVYGKGIDYLYYIKY